MNLSRRSVILGIGSGVLLLGGVAAVRSVTPGDPAPGFAVLDAEAARIGRVLAERFIGPDHAAVPVMEEIDATLAALPEVGEVWRKLPLLFERAPLIDGYMQPFTALGAADQEAVLEGRAAASKLVRRQIYRGLHDLIVSHFYMHAASWPLIRYGGPWVGRIELPVHAPRFDWRQP